MRQLGFPFDDEERARARNTDPITSHVAAERATTGLRAKQEAVLGVLRRYGPMTDPEILARYSTLQGLPEQSPSGLRTRRCELCDKGLVVNTGEKRRLPSGGLGFVWGAVRIADFRGLALGG